MNSTAIRLVCGGRDYRGDLWNQPLVRAQTEPPEVEMPKWTFRTMPLQLGDWHGEDTKLDPTIAAGHRRGSHRGSRLPR